MQILSWGPSNTTACLSLNWWPRRDPSWNKYHPSPTKHISSTSTYKPLALDSTEVLSSRIESHWFLVNQLTKPWLHHISLVLGHPTHKTSATLSTQTTHRSVPLLNWLLRLDNRRLNVWHIWRIPDLWRLTVQLTSTTTRKQSNWYIWTFNSFLLLSNTLAFFYRRNEHFNQYINRTFSNIS